MFDIADQQYNFCPNWSGFERTENAVYTNRHGLKIFIHVHTFFIQ